VAVLYLVEQNTVIRKSGRRVLICRRPQKGKTSGYVRQDDILLDLPCADIDQMMIFGNVQVTTQALHTLLHQNIELAIFTQSGKLLGQLTPPKPKNITLRLNQYHKFHEPVFCLDFAKDIIKVKLSSAHQTISTWAGNHPGIFSRSEMKLLKENIHKTDRITTIQTLRGHEGASMAFYFSLFGRMFKSPWQFKKRIRRPPRDPVNALLSYGYVVLGAEIQALLDGVGFDPYLGFYHQPSYGRPSLALDLLEEFRHSVIDRLVLTLLNKKLLKVDDFYPSGNGGIYLNKNGKKIFFNSYHKRMGQFQSDAQIALASGIRKTIQNRVFSLCKTVNNQTDW
jgi:CRISPR-associated protein Cas1